MAGEMSFLETQEYAWLGQTAGSEIEDENVARYKRWRAGRRAPQPPCRPQLGELIASALAALALGVALVAVTAIAWLEGRL